MFFYRDWDIDPILQTPFDYKSGTQLCNERNKNQKVEEKNVLRCLCWASFLCPQSEDLQGANLDIF